MAFNSVHQRWIENKFLLVWNPTEGICWVEALPLLYTGAHITKPAATIWETKASDYAISAALTQQGHPVASHSKTLSDIVWKYPTYDKEMYSIVQTYCQWKHYILGRKQSSIETTDPCGSYKHKGSCRTIVIRNGPHTCNSSIWALSIRREAPIML